MLHPDMDCIPSLMALNFDAGNGKAMYRRGLARLRLGHAQGAVEDFAEASRLEPDKQEVCSKLDEAQESLKEIAHFKYRYIK